MLDSRWIASAHDAAKASMDSAILAEIAGRPGFRDLIPAFVQTWRVGTGESADLARALRDVAQYLSGIWAMQLHFTPGGLTLSRLAETLRRTGLSSPGRARSMLIFMRFMGHIEPSPAFDGRERRYRPTSKMLRAFKARLKRDVVALWPAHPAILAIGAEFDRDEVFAAYVTGIGEMLTEAFPLYVPAGRPTMETVTQKFGGSSVLGELLLSCPEQSAIPPVGPLPVTLSGLARDAQISRPQARAVLKAAQQAGFLMTLPDGRYQLTPLMAEHTDLLLAGTLITLAYAATRAVAVLEAAPKPRARQA
ncbi:hypothetical protein GVN21_13130 [Caulobacter sp. SLTY]|uniref:hypothetical protein n=1 Tax=Caulobacter sp. SLTY TaxID=2683262 RepID=UPI0014120375|nr:hypothetical protein [Caulobacter sp. SLTY]NBB16303.1 hypothetical protein [Caulobacter sp. SLTY]